MTEARWHLTYSQETVAEPIVWALGHELGLVTNIRRADVRDHIAWVILDVRGEREQLETARAWLEDRGLHVSVLTED
ncbi:MAG: NIL domain-containing protein [Mycobacteriales bacterium]